MWTRKLLKDNAKQILRRSYAVALAICALAGAIGAGLPNRQNPFAVLFSLQQLQPHNPVLDFNVSSGSLLDYLSILPPAGSSSPVPRVYSYAYSMGITLAAIVIFAAVAAVVFSAFISMPLQVGKNRAFLENRVGVPGFSGLLFSFKANYLRIVGGMFTTKLFTELPLLVAGIVWFAAVGIGGLGLLMEMELLFTVWMAVVLAGLAVSLVLEYRWRLVPWLLAENPSLTGAEARRISAAVTRGEKWNIFVLDLSFLGWAVLALIPLGWGFLLLNPYIEATNAELYTALRAKALAQDICTAQQLPGVPAARPWPAQPPAM